MCLNEFSTLRAKFKTPSDSRIMKNNSTRGGQSEIKGLHSSLPHTGKVSRECRLIAADS